MSDKSTDRLTLEDRRQTEPLYRFYGHVAPAESERTGIKAEVTALKNGSVATIRLYDPIDSWGGIWGVSAKELTAALDEVGKVDTIRLRINSPGGEAFEGIAIYNALVHHEAEIEVIVDGLAASAASIVAMAGDSITMNRGSQMMIHDAWGICIGNADDMEKLSEELAHMSDNLASVYSDRAGGSVDDWRQAMKDETWYSPEEAVKAGLATKVGKKAPSNSEAKARFDLTIFNHAGRADAPAPSFASKDDTKVDSAPDNVLDKQAQETSSMTPEQLQAINLPEDATDDQINERLAELAALETSESETQGTETESTGSSDDSTETESAGGEGDAGAQASFQVPEGHYLVNKAVFDSIQSKLGQFDEMVAKQETKERDDYIVAAMKVGKFPPADRKLYENTWALNKDNAKALIDALPVNRVPVDAVGRGDSDGQETSTEDDAYPAEWNNLLRVKEVQA